METITTTEHANTLAMARINARLMADERFGPDADTEAPEVKAWVEAFAQEWTAGVLAERNKARLAFAEPGADKHRRMVIAMLEVGADLPAIRAALSATEEGR